MLSFSLLFLNQPLLSVQTDMENDTIVYISEWLVSKPVPLRLPAFHDQKNLEGDLDAFIEQLREKGVLV